MTSSRTTTTHQAPDRTGIAVTAMYVGLLLTIVATVCPFIDRGAGHLLADHIRHGYPAYTANQVDTAVTVWLGILSVVGVLGVVGWASSIWAVKAHKAWARPIATILFLVGTGLALSALLAKDTSGEVGLPPLLGWVGMLPSVAGLAAVAMLWASPAGRSESN